MHYCIFFIDDIIIYIYISYIYVGVSKNSGTPKWMVYNGNPYLNGWFGCTTIFGNIHVYLYTVYMCYILYIYVNSSRSFLWADLGNCLPPIIHHVWSNYSDLTRPKNPQKGSCLVSGNGTPAISGKSMLVESDFNLARNVPKKIMGAK